MTLRVATYTRVSTVEQADTNHSLDAQASVLEAHAAAHGWTVTHRFTDPGWSGTTPDRPGLTALLHTIQNKDIDVVLVYRLDRLARKPGLAYKLIEDFTQSGVAFKSVTEQMIDNTTPMGKVAFGVITAFAEWERDTFIARSQSGTHKAIEKGQWPGGITPYGYRVHDKRLTVDEQAAEAVRLIYHLCATEGHSTVTISDRLTALGIPPHYQLDGRGVRGKSTVTHWRPGGVLRILKNPVYKGLPEYGKRNARAGTAGTGIVVGTAPVIVTPEIWERAQLMLSRNRLTALRNARNIYMLKSLIKCGSCGRTYVGSKAAKPRNEYYYGCTGRTVRGGRPESERCASPYVRGHDLDDHIRQGIRRILSNPDEALKAHEGQRPDLLDNQITQAERATQDTTHQRARLLDLYLSGDLDKGVYLERQAAIETRLQGLTLELTTLRDAARQQASAEHRARDVLALSAQLADRLDTLTDQEWQTLAHELVARVTVRPDGSTDVTWAL
ncbi:recombinase family protein [Deinococcus aquiradiocola]|uniref:Integrase n=1 Tax=Deinococcus aquiradiocola TaxID=393059 RepID=A0A917P7I8_9DEIO|nr:recombinase family protein [Deinococcus aquiradiocola]GGJ65100.1 integrase [Deinococcus aquiradiocola]